MSKLFKNLSNLDNAIAKSMIHGACMEILNDKETFIKESSPNGKTPIISPQAVIEAAENIIKELGGE